MKYWELSFNESFIFKVQSFKMAGYQFAMDYRTQFTSTTVTLANIDFITNSGKIKRWKDVFIIHSFSGIAVLQNLTRVTKNLDIGAELLYQANPMIPGGHIGITSFITRYRGMNKKIIDEFHIDLSFKVKIGLLLLK